MTRSREIRPGTRVPIPCRFCARRTIPFEVKEGIWGVECPECLKVTEVFVKSNEGRLQIRTRRVP